MKMFVNELAGKIWVLLKFTRIHHSLFALPFLLLGVLEYTTNPSLLLLLYSILAFIGIRCFAIIYSDIIDLDYDRRNPRARDRPLVKGEVSVKEAWIVAVVMLALYLIGIYLIDHVVYLLWWIPIILIFVYPYLKRYIPISHFILGTILAIAPWGGYIVFSRQIEFGCGDLAIGLLVWVAGFDIIYHIQDIEVSREYGIKTVPSIYGPYTSIRVAGILYLISIFLLFLNWIHFSLGDMYLLGIITVLYIYLRELRLLRRGLTREYIMKSFNLNLLIGPILLLSLIADLLL